MRFRLAVLGGSAVSTVQLIDAIADWPGGSARRPHNFELVLHGRSTDRLTAVSAACRMRAAAAGIPVVVRPEHSLVAALDGADVVLNQIRVGGLAARAVDESFPHAHGLPGEETMGPGGLACAVRTVSALRPVWAQIACRAPDALIVNLTNPAGIVQQAARAAHDLPIVTVCDSPVTLLERVADKLGRHADEVRERYVGMNHVGWYVPTSGSELAHLADVGDDLPAIYEALPAAYMRYYAFPGRILAAQQGRPTRAQELLAIQHEALEAYRDGVLPAAWRRDAPWYRTAVLPLIDAWINGSADVLILGLPNAGRLAWLPSDVILEGPAVVRGPGRVDLQPLAALPDLPRGLLAEHAAYERLTVEALAHEPTSEGLSRAMLANPMVTDLDQATALAADIQARIADPYA
jgi:6-phospho-beta-glucosidase